MIKRFFCTLCIAVALSALQVSGQPQSRRREAMVLIALPEPSYPPRSIPLRTRFIGSLGGSPSVNLHNDPESKIGNRLQA